MSVDVNMYGVFVDADEGLTMNILMGGDEDTPYTLSIGTNSNSMSERDLVALIKLLTKAKKVRKTKYVGDLI